MTQEDFNKAVELLDILSLSLSQVDQLPPSFKAIVEDTVNDARKLLKS